MTRYETIKHSGRTYKVTKDLGIGDNMRRVFPTLQRQLVVEGVRGHIFMAQIFKSGTRMTNSRGNNVR